MNEALLAGVMFAVSAGSTAVHCAAWWRLARGPVAVGHAERRIRHGLMRTVACRALAAVVYVGVAVVTVVARPALPTVALVVFTGTQLLWQLNSFLDVRLRRDLARRHQDDPPA